VSTLRCRATVGEVGNAEQANINWGKAGRMRWKGKAPHGPCVVMNPVDHPHGGGEGKTSGGRHPVSPWGKPEGRTRKDTSQRQAHRPTPGAPARNRARAADATQPEKVPFSRRHLLLARFLAGAPASTMSLSLGLWSLRVRPSGLPHGLDR